MPNVFADQIECFCECISEREKVCVSLHNHNDRGCAVAATEMAQLAGADRVEGCLFGNGERTGNVDLITLALNLYTQGIHPGVDFSDINSITSVFEESTKILVHVRAPYVGKYVFCTFTGAHQDAIRKGYKNRDSTQAQKWKMPYIPLDPQDLGREHEAIIRVNSQSGKSGSAWPVKEAFHIDLPRDLEVHFSQVVQTHADTLGDEVKLQTISHLF
jgi:2-isopropylmalate synthase